MFTSDQETYHERQWWLCLRWSYQNIKSFEHSFVPRCYHCYKFKHFSSECPGRNMPVTCVKCAGRQKTRNCNRNSQRKWVYCVQNCEWNFKHNAFSHEFPAKVKATFTKNALFIRINRSRLVSRPVRDINHLRSYQVRGGRRVKVLDKCFEVSKF